MLSRLLPARAKKQEGPVTDLDAIVAESVSFRFKGKNHTLHPIDMETFLKFTNAQSSLMRVLNDKENVLTTRGLAEKYFEVINPLCASISLKDIMDMEQVQIAALYQLIIDMVTGQVPDTGDGKKKRQKINIYDSVRV
jgi:hypothetical protein